jgi:hypothetical protein
MSLIDPSVELLHREFVTNKLYGEITTKYEAGRVVLLKKTESIKPASQRSTRDEGEQES